MKLETITNRLIGMPYRFDNGPLKVHNLTQAQELKGINCQAATHLALRALGLHLPPYMRSAEIYEDNTLLRDVQSGEKLAPGDIFVFRRKGLVDPKSFHLAPVVETQGEVYLLNASYYNGRTVRISTPTEIERDASSEVAAIKRPR